MDKNRWIMLSAATCGAVVLTSALWWLTAKPLMADIAQEPTALLRHGKQVFQKAGCWYCHHPSLTGLRSGELSSHFANENGWVAYFYNPKMLRPQAAKSAYRGLLKQRKDGRMTLNQDGRALLAYLRKARDTSFVPGHRARRLVPLPTGVQAQQGLQLYQVLCASCHGQRGFGDGPLAKILPTPPRDLTRPSQWLCRISDSAGVQDLRRTLEHQTGGCGMIAIKDSLTQEQRRELLNAVRRIAGFNKEVTPHTALAWDKPKRPGYSDLRKRDFRDWLNKMWQQGYDQWLARWRNEHSTKAYIPFRHWRTWRDWVEWQSFGLWAQKHAEKLRIARGDWRAFLQQRPRLRSVFQAWLKQGRKQPWIKFLKRTLRRELIRDLERKYQAYLQSRKMSWPAWDWRTVINPVKWWAKWKGWRHRSNWMKYELRRQWTLWLQRYDYQEYKDWRERRERDLFRDWRNEQRIQMYWAWQGRKVYVDMGCTSCHGNQGEGKIIYTTPPSTTITGSLRKPIPVHVSDLRNGALRCGSQWDHVYRSIVVGVGQHMKGLTERKLRRYLKNSGRNTDLWRLTQTRQAQKLRKDLWSLAAYVRYLGHHIPIMRSMRK